MEHNYGSPEELLKNAIKEKHGSVLSFSKAIGIPESSIRNIFNRGVDSVNAGVLVKICKNLNLDVESLLAGSLSVRPNEQKNQVWQQYVSAVNSGIIPVDLSKYHSIPILGRISAGLPIYAEENIEGYTLVDLNDGGEYFALRIQGDSMTAARIQDGDLVIVRRQPEVENGEIAVVLVGDDEATIKRFYVSKDTVTLIPQSNNPAHRPQIYNLKNTPVKVLGKVIRVEFTL